MSNTYKIFSYFLTLTFGFIVISGCTESNELPDRGYTLVWADEFDGTTGDPPNPEFWNYDIGTGDEGWGNNELQYYTNRTENIYIDGRGSLVIKAINEPFGGRNFTSARITTKGLKEFQYGRIEARIKTPFGQGLWPAFWMLGADIDQIGWPQTGEIDIMELRGQEPSKILGSIHGPGYSGENAISQPFQLFDSRFDTDFHVFAVEWGPDFIDFFVDQRLYNRLKPEDLPAGTDWVFDKPFFILLNVAVGGNFVGSPSSNSRFPQTMLIDYVRVYQ
ncbi:glycoside hydrolase family 16 protein [Algoriphagus kandeliae]|uniref:Glycoside hydrolase family 16 protein n=1 Tax=Algoriphagus kandeliae TaxID=2562278 RepID=A0A4Y9QZR8_9BACT|nr:glycoside hydrolase family 16 protein [Algoriphagus kandeliae]TFV97677.1 glycoside hydrolase family 16 protein [Algoriphagus kandeliae]